MKKKMNPNNIFGFVYFKPWYNIPSHIRQIIKIIKYAIERMTKGYCSYDRYDIDIWFLQTVPAMLREFAKETHSYPHNFLETCNKINMGIHKTITNQEEQKGQEEKEEKDYTAWCNYLNEIAGYLENASTDYYDKIDLDLTPTDSNRLNEVKDFQKYRVEELHKGLSMLESVFFDLWD